MRILIIGNPNSIWIKNYVKYVLLPLHYSITLLSYGVIRNEFSKYYIDNNIQIIGNFSSNSLSYINRLKLYIEKHLFLTASKLYGKFEYIHIHYVTYGSLRLGFLARSKKTTVIATPWGSDLLRASHDELRRRIRYLSRVDIITLQSDKLLDVFKNSYGDLFKSKIVIGLKFGMDIFKEIDRVKTQMTIEMCKKHYSFNPHSIVISIGYNGSTSQQHLPVLESISRLSHSFKEIILVYLHVSYAIDSNDYIERLRTYMNNADFKIVIIDQFLNNYNISILRNATDIFIHAQLTDEYSASVQEYLYAGCVVYNPSWIPYNEFKNSNIEYIEYPNFERLTDLLQSTLINFTRPTPNKEAILRLSSWESHIEGWTRLYALDNHFHE